MDYTVHEILQASYLPNSEVVTCLQDLNPWSWVRTVHIQEESDTFKHFLNFILLLLILFIFGCTESSLLHPGFL